MPQQAPTRRRAPAHHGARRSPAPRHARRASGPVAHPVAAVALPVPRRGGTGVFERIRALPDHRVVDRLLRGRACIWMIGILLGGIVAMQVSLLKLNASITQRVEQASTLERVNADLETEVARLSSSERIQATAIKEGMVAPSAGDVAYLSSRVRDARLAARRMTAPSDDARDVMANGGYEVAPVLAATTAPATVAPAGTAVTPAGTAVTTPATTAVPPAPTPTPPPEATPVPTPPAAVAPAPTVAPQTGATIAPTG